MNKFFLIFLSALIGAALSAMESVPTKSEPQAIVQDLLVDKVTDFRLSPVQKYWIGVFFKGNKTCVVSELKDDRTLFLSTAEKKCLITSCSKSGTFLKVYGNKESFIENRCASDCSECDEIVKAIGPNPLMRALESIIFSKQQSEFLGSHLWNGPGKISKTARIVPCSPNSGDKKCCVIKDGENVLVPCEVHGKKEPKRRVAGFSWVSCARALLKPTAFAAGLYVASRIPESWIGYCKSLFSR